MLSNASEYVVLGRKQETSTTTTLSIAKIDGTIPHYLPGQHLTIYFPDLSQTLGKQYSISSAPSEEKCTITIKAIGRFSNRLCSLSHNERIMVSQPHGTFSPKQMGNIILLAGGMGVTPFRSIIFDTLVVSPAVPIRLLYSSKLATDMPFSDELYELSKQHRLFTMERFVTKEFNVQSRKLKYRRMRLDDILNGNDSKQTQFLISGSLDFVLELKNILTAAGISREYILTETHF